jgi:shikimate kinase / 3-dehydroquinate synthase
VDRVERVVLIGFSGTGKTTVARMLAARLGWAAADIDAEIERSWEKSIPAIFRDDGEAAFRARERAILRETLDRGEVVVAAGGGVAAQPGAWDEDLLGRPGTLVLALDARPETVLARLREQAAREGAAVERPLLAAADPLERVRGLKADRQASYDAAHLTISTDGIPPDEAAAEIAQVVGIGGGAPLAHRLAAASGASEIVVAPGAVAALGERVRACWPQARRTWIVTDDRVGPLHGDAVAAALGGAGIAVSMRSVPPGEGSKSLATAGLLYDWLLGGGIERGDVVVALGGGIVGDLAGFVAATVLRGVGFVQVPTTLLAAVDSSVGGKTGINHAAGKNLIGAFLQPPLVVVDTALLRTVPPRELRSGWAEVVKHAVIQRSTPGGERNDLEAVLARNGDRLARLEEPALAYLVWRNIQLKSAVVAADEREAGIRAYLNFGHTLGHAIEASDYRLLHGEAVAVGMRAEALLGVAAGTCSTGEAERIASLISRFGLPAAAAFDRSEALTRMGSDKKRVAGRQRFVLPLTGGGVTIRDDVPAAAVAAALAAVTADVPVA